MARRFGMSPTLISIAVVQVLTILVALVRSKLLSVLLGPANFGVVSTVDQVVMTMVQLGALGLPFTGLKYMAFAHSRGAEAFQETSSSFVRLLGLLSIVTTVVASVIFVWFPGVFGYDLVAYRLALQIALIGIPAVTLNILLVNTLAAAEQPATAAQLNLIVALNLASGAIIGGWVNGVTGLYVGVAIAGAVGLAGSLWFLRRRLGLRLLGHPGALVRDLRARPEIIKSSASVYLAMAVYSLSLLAIRATVLTELGAVQAGLLQASLSIALTVGAILSPMNNLFLGPLVNQDTLPEAKASAANGFAGEMLVLLLLGALPIVLFPRLILGILFTSAFAPAAGALGLFVLWQCVYQIGFIYQQLLIGLDDMFYMAVTTAAGYGSAALLSVFLVPRAGLSGVAIALVTGMLLYGTAAALRLQLRFGIRVPSRVIGRSAYVATAVGGGSWLFLGRQELSVVAVGGRIGYALAALGILWLGMTPEERSRIRTAPGQMLRHLRPPSPATLP